MKKKMNLKILKYGSNSIAIIVIVVVIAVLLNAIVSIFDYKIDLTGNRLYSLTENSKEILSSINKEVNICVLEDKVKNESDAAFSTVINMMENYKNLMGDKVKIDYKEPAKYPGIYDEMGLSNVSDTAKQSMIAIVKSGDKVKPILYMDMVDTQSGEYTIESAFTGAIYYVTAETTPTVYFVTGHGEKNVSTTYTNMISTIEANNYTVKTFDLMTKKSIPEDADVLMFMSPKNDINQDERDMLYKYVEAGKDMIVLFDATENKDEFKNFNRLLERYNLKINADKVYETNDNYMEENNKYSIMSLLSDAEVNSSLQSNPIWLELTRSFSIINNAKDNIMTETFLVTSPSSVSENVLTNNKVKGIAPVGVTSQYVNNEGRARIVLLGDSDFLSDAYRESKANFWNVGIREITQLIDWVSEAKDKVYVGSKAIGANKLTVSGGQISFVITVTWLVLPVLFLIIAIIVYRRRKNL